MPEKEFLASWRVEQVEGVEAVFKQWQLYAKMEELTTLSPRSLSCWANL